MKLPSELEEVAILPRVQQICIEDDFNRKNIRHHVRKEINEGIDGFLKIVFARCVKEIDTYLNKTDYYESKQQRILTIRHMCSEEIATELFMAVIPNSEATPIQNVSYALGTHFNFSDVFDGVRTGAEILAVTCDTGLHDIWATPLLVRSKVSLDEETIQYIERTRYMDPMIVPPNPWTNNHDGGYLSVCNSVLLGKHHHHDEYQGLDVLNILQNIPLELNEHILQYAEEPKKGMDSLDTKDKLKAWKQHTALSKEVYTAVIDRGNTYYHPWCNDFRGRVYSQGHYVNLQSTSYKKALTNLKNKRLIK